MNAKRELLEYISNPVLTTSKNSMGGDENWYNPYFVIKQTFSIEEINSMSEMEVENLVRLGNVVSILSKIITGDVKVN